VQAILSFISSSRVRLILNRIGEKLWVKPLVYGVLSIGAVLGARWVDAAQLGIELPKISVETLESLLSVMASSMLVIAIFAVGSMLSAYASASGSATPRSFPLIVADDVSQNALSTFIGAFIFSIVGLTATKTAYYQNSGLFTLLVLTFLVFSLVVLTFTTWVDSIAKLGRLGTTIAKVEDAAMNALKRRIENPTLGGKVSSLGTIIGYEVLAEKIGYVQNVDVAKIQEFASEQSIRVRIVALPGAFVCKGQVLATVEGEKNAEDVLVVEQVTDSFLIGRERRFENDPRFGIIALTEIAGRALSPGINDPGTAIVILGSFTRLLARLAEPGNPQSPLYDRVEVPELSVTDLFEDAFVVIGRDGAGDVEVAVRLQKTLEALANMGDMQMSESAKYHARLALARSETAMSHSHDINAVRQAAKFAL
jgi:uncharacterized membrane protein